MVDIVRIDVQFVLYRPIFVHELKFGTVIDICYGVAMVAIDVQDAAESWRVCCSPGTTTVFYNYNN